jgi:two-component system osmolarity sensor histidine kinase EnvZ
MAAPIDNNPFPRKGLRRFVPSSLFGRALLILVVPTIIVQLLALYMFYERHWASVARNMSTTLANDVALLVQEARYSNDDDREAWRVKARHTLGIIISYPKNTKDFRPDTVTNTPYPDFYNQLHVRLALPFSLKINHKEDTMTIFIKLRDDVMRMDVSRKRLMNPTTSIFTLWIFSTTGLLLAISTIFLRNQIRPITRLARAAEAFGTGRDDPEFSPRGAKEIRQAGHAFLRMRNRVQRQIATRSAMLSGISHDLRTPLTRMKLQLAMMNDTKAAASLEADIATMQHMIQEYLDYARGSGGEETQLVDVREIVRDLASRHAQAGSPVSLEEEPENATILPLRRLAILRTIDNLITNALRYGKRCRIYLHDDVSYVYIMIEDDGTGIAETDHELVFAPFRRLEGSRNTATGGVGLGLTIAREIAQGHGGDIYLSNRTDASGQVLGLSVCVKLPKQSFLDE